MSSRFAATYVFRCDDGTYMHERAEHVGDSFEEALAQALRDGRGRAFGRTFEGLSRFEPTSAEPIVIDELVPVHVGAEASLLALPAVEPSPEPERVRELDGIAEVEWWREEGAFGPASELGLALERCGCRDPDVARDAAELVGEWIGHQMTLYPATATALPFLLRWLERRDLSCGDVLEEWVRVIADVAYDDTPIDLEALREEVAEIPEPMRTILFPDGVEARYERERALERAVRDVFTRERARVEQLASWRPMIAPVLASMKRA